MYPFLKRLFPKAEGEHGIVLPTIRLKSYLPTPATLAPCMHRLLLKRKEYHYGNE